MTRSPHALAVPVLSTIVAGSLLAALPAHACPLSASRLAAKTVQKPVPTGVQAGVQAAQPTPPAGPTPLNQAGLLGLGTIAGLLALGIAYKLHHLRQPALVVWHPHPELEHPELALTVLPSEALPCVSSDVAEASPLALTR